MGWNGSGGAPAQAAASRPPRKPSALRGVCAGLVALLAGCGVLVWFAVRDGDSQESVVPADGGRKRINDSRPAAAGSRADDEQRSARPAARQPKPAAGVREEREPQVAEVPEEPVSKEAGVTNKAPKLSILTNAVEHLLSLATPSAPGVEVPPLPEITDEGLAKDLKRALSHVSTATDDDTEETIGRKLAVEDRKAEFIELNRAGKVGIADFLKAVREQYNDDAKFLAEAHKLDQEVRADETVSDADYQKTREQINQALEERGLPKLEPLEEKDSGK